MGYEPSNLEPHPSVEFSYRSEAATVVANELLSHVCVELRIREQFFKHPSVHLKVDQLLTDVNLQQNGWQDIRFAQS